VLWGDRAERARRAERPPPVLRPGRAWPEGMRPTQAGTGMVRYLVRLALSAVERKLQIALGVLLLLVLTSTTILRLGYVEPDGRRMSWLDALYFTVETIGTVGYGDFYFREQRPWLRFYAIGLMIFGAMLATVFFALLTNVLVSRRIEEQLGRRRVPGMSGHTVVIGVGAVGVGVVEGLLARGREVVVVDADEANRYLGQVRALGVPVVIGDATLVDTLDAANVPGAGSVAVLTSDDLTNLETALAVRDRLGERWTATPVVVRLFDRQLASTVERSFGFHHVRSTAALAAPWFVGAALGLDVLGTFYVADRPLLLGRLPVTPDSGLVGLAMQELGASIRVIGIERAGEGRLEHPPRRATTFQAGDQAYLVGPYEELLRVLRRDAAQPSTPVVPTPR
jgi:Trk K+ transport system NAD-binding subunit